MRSGCIYTLRFLRICFDNCGFFLQEKEENVERLARETEKLAHADFEKAEETVVIVNKLQIDFRNLVSRLDERRRILTKTQAFYQSGHKVCLVVGLLLFVR